MSLWPKASAVAESAVAGERGIAAVHQERSLHARLGNLLAAALMGVLGLAALAWYYGHALAHSAAVRERAQRSTQSRAEAEAPLVPLGRVDRPVRSDPPAPSPSGDIPAHPDALPETVPGAGGALVQPAMPVTAYLNPAPAPGFATGEVTPAAKTPGQLALERRLSANVFRRGAELPEEPALGQMREAVVDEATPRATPSAGPASAASERWRPAEANTPTVQARVLPTQRFLLPKGAFIDCTLETAIDSTLPGVATCVTATDTFGADGSVVLLERGTKLMGETQGQVLQGATRVGVIWTEARTPMGVVVALDSPATDELGRAGLPGSVNRHFWERFGAAILITTLDGAVQAGVQSAAHGSGTVIYNPAPSEAIGTEVLKGTLAITPTIVKRQGDRVQAVLARDLDFRSVYELRLVSAPR